ncbi:membrane protein insertase YidC [Pseudonocardia sp. KRD291]|uniref:membrane protein insertase YidC n=1 Tax=Pseudonocardia sp. KRD291 TaxID=2792007 RepID=UPI001C4A36B7|nr:membrane protein insertase YidC [Pseudonocardia sp. KRD291]MBW0106455.1 membrane protein insertase YidC [Pseudonocardia sp. KRD291]
MLDVLYYPVSGLMWAWHQLFGALLGPTSGLSWALAVVFLVLTVRALLVRPALRQMRSARRMRVLGPELARLRERHRGDTRRLAEQTRALHAAHGTSPLAGMAPLLLQLPVFVALLHVLRSFNRPGLSLEANAAIANYAFGADDVRSFLQARLFGAPLSAWMSMPSDLLDSFGGAPVAHAHVVAVVVPLAVLAAVATHLSARLSRRRVPAPEPGADPAAALMSRITGVLPWVLPIGVLGGGLLFPVPVALLLYWLTGSVATLVQQWLLARIVDREPLPERPPERTPEPEAVRRATGPRPGRKPLPGQKPLPGRTARRAH